MVRRRRLGNRWATALVAVSVTALAAFVPARGSLYGQVYPRPGSNVIEALRDFREALVDADLRVEIDGRPAGEAALVENEPAQLRAVVTPRSAGGPPSDLRVAFANEATLRSATCTPACEFDIRPEGPLRLDFAAQVPLVWKWDVTPRAVGHLQLILEIQPVVLLPTGEEPVDKVNKPFEVDVEVHSNRLAYEAVLQAAEDLTPELPDAMTVGRDSPVRATLDGVRPDVRTEIVLTTDEGSVPVAIEQTATADGQDSVVREWSIEAQEAGVADLVFKVDVAARVGDRELGETVDVHRSITVRDPPPSLWDRLQGPVLWLSPFAALVGTVVAAYAAMNVKRRRTEE